MARNPGYAGGRLNAARKLVTSPDPAGLDKLILAAGEGVARWAEGVLASRGVTVNIWDGRNGLGAVLGEHIEAAGIPNKRAHELLTPRAVVEMMAPKKRKRAIR